MKKNSKKAISMIGLGKLGIPIATCLAYKNYKVIGIDTDFNKIKAINQKICPIYEPGVQNLLEKVEDRFTATDDYNLAINNSDISFILVPTPSDECGSFSLKYVIPVCKKIGRVLAKKSNFHLVVLTSTVMPGATGGLEVKGALETYSNKICGKDFGLCYSPEFVALGSVIKNFLYPDFLLIGESDERSGNILTSLYKDVCEDNAPIMRMNFINAEITKLALNSYITMKISFANTLAEICEKLPGGNVDNVTSALGMDSRIGSKYLKGALGFCGPCFPRDTIAFSYMANQIGAQSLLAKTADRINQHQIRRIIDLIRSKLPKDGKVGILGLTYKPNTDITERSQGLEIAQSLSEMKIPVTVYDPAPLGNFIKQILGENLYLAMSTIGCIGDADVVVITTAWDEFKKINAKDLRNKIVIDCWRILKPEQYKDCKEYIAIGINNKRKRS